MCTLPSPKSTELNRPAHSRFFKKLRMGMGISAPRPPPQHPSMYVLGCDGGAAATLTPYGIDGCCTALKVIPNLSVRLSRQLPSSIKILLPQHHRSFMFRVFLFFDDDFQSCLGVVRLFASLSLWIPVFRSRSPPPSSVRSSACPGVVRGAVPSGLPTCGLV